MRGKMVECSRCYRQPSYALSQRGNEFLCETCLLKESDSAYMASQTAICDPNDVLHMPQDATYTTKCDDCGRPSAQLVKNGSEMVCRRCAGLEPMTAET